MKQGMELPMCGCCAHRKEDLAYYLDPCKNSSFDTFKRKNYSNGFYFGSIKDEERHGFGYYVWNDDSIYAGYWIDNKKDGDGIFIDSDGSVRFEKYSAGKPNGRFFSGNGNGVKIEIDFKNGDRIHIYSSSDDIVDKKERISISWSSKPSGCFETIGYWITGIIIACFILRMCS
ncbi:MAG: hypothetical protein LBF05_06370 [Tannerella sp.]|nr:hypothetical protein [Tannerella sp.]